MWLCVCVCVCMCVCGCVFLQLALSIRMKVFGGHNLHVAIAHEDLAYATYVYEYSSGKFSDARSVCMTILCPVT